MSIPGLHKLKIEPIDGIGRLFNIYLDDTLLHGVTRLVMCAGVDEITTAEITMNIDCIEGEFENCIVRKVPEELKRSDFPDCDNCHRKAQCEQENRLLDATTSEEVSRYGHGGVHMALGIDEKCPLKEEAE